jgi:putative endonuclease
LIGNKTGKLGEDIAAYYLKGKGFRILEQNFWKPYGEIDIVAEKGSKLHFVEVKAVSRESYNAAQNVHAHKLKKLGRVIQAFLMKHTYRDRDWQFDICVVQIDTATKKAKIKMISNELLPE